MLLPAATLPVNAEQFHGLLGAMEAFAVPGCIWKNWKSRNQLYEMPVPNPVVSIELPANGTSDPWRPGAWCLTQIIVISGLIFL